MSAGKFDLPNKARRQSGAALIMSLVILLIMTILGISAMGTSTLEQKMAGNTQEATRAFEAAESGLSKALQFPENFNLNTAQTKTYEFGTGGKSGNAKVTTKFVQFTPPKRGSGFGISFDTANFDQLSEGKTLTSAKTVVHQGVAVVVPK